MGRKSCLCRSPGLLCSSSIPESPSVSPGHMAATVSPGDIAATVSLGHMAGSTQSYKGAHRFFLLVRFLECSLPLTLTPVPCN